jgi:hypothetical protein
MTYLVVTVCNFVNISEKDKVVSLYIKENINKAILLLLLLPPPPVLMLVTGITLEHHHDHHHHWHNSPF